MNFLDTLIATDHKVLFFLNNLGSESFDTLWLTITKPANWLPLVLIWLTLLIKNFGWKQGLFIFLFLAVMGGLSDQLVNLIKNTTLRPRPCWQEGVMEQIRVLKCTHSYSFVSGHATISMMVTTFLFLFFKDKYKWFAIFYLFPILFAYSRIYMGKHYPGDILCGYTLGFFLAMLYYKIANYIYNTWFVKQKQIL